MRRNSGSESAVFNPRGLFAFTLWFTGALLAMLGFAVATPARVIKPNGSVPASPGLVGRGPDSFTLGALFVRAPFSPSLATNPPVVHVIGACVPMPGEKCEEWNTVYDGPLHNDTPGDQIFSSRVIQSSTDGRTVFVTGFSLRSGGKDSAATIAYDAATGSQQWLQRYDGTPDLPECVSIALAVNSGRVYAGGFCFARDSGTGIPLGFYPTVLAYDTQGNLLWSNFFSTPEFSSVRPNDVIVSPDDSMVYVEGIAQVANPVPDGPTYEMLTIAFDSSGNLMWYRPVDEAKSGGMQVRVSPDSGTVYATGETLDAVGHTTGMYVRAYSATGDLRWSNLFQVPTNVIGNPPTGLAVTPDGSRVFLAGDSQNAVGVWNYDTVAYDSSDGAIVWHQRSTDAGQTWPYSPIAISQDGSLVYVTGTTGTGIESTTPTRFGFDTIAYNSATGAVVWESTLDDALNVYLYPFPGLDVNPKNGEVYVSGPDWQAPGAYSGAAIFAIATYSAGYDGKTGQQLWNSLVSAGSTTFVGVAAIADGSRAVVTTYSTTPEQYAGAPNNPPINWLTFAYPATIPLSIVSEKSHGLAGFFDIPLSVSGPPGIECRSGGANGDYTLIFTFPQPVVSCGTASVTGCGAAVSSSSSGPSNQCTVDLTNVSNACTLTVTLASVIDTAGNINDMSVPMGVLLGDVNASRRVDAADVSLVRQQTLQPVNDNPGTSNFREDINASGRIDAGDVSIARQQTLTSLP